MEVRNVIQRTTAIALILAATACAGGGAPGARAPAPDPPLAYGMPPVTPLVYGTADTVRIEMEIAGTAVQVAVHARSTMEAGFTHAGGDALNAIIRYTAMEGSFSNSMAAPIRISDSDIPAPATLRLDPRGEATVVDLPEATETFRQVFGSEGAYRRLFIRLPGRVVQTGAVWTDTVSLSEDVGPMVNETTQVITSTLAGDTVVNGVRLQIINSEISGTTRISGSNQGFEFRQILNGASTAVTLWDPVRRTIVERTETTNAQGSMEMPAMGMTGLPVRMTSTAIIRLQQNQASGGS